MISRRQLGLGALALPMLGRAARAEVSTVRIARQYGLPYLPLMVMEHERLVEKHAARLGLPNLQTAWPQLGGTGAIADGIISRQLDFAGAGATALLTLWDKTAGTPQEVLSLSAIQSMPFLLMTSNLALQSLDDLGDNDRIAVPAVKISAQALLLEMAAAKRWGMENYQKLDRLTVSLPHPDAMVSLLSGGTSVDCHYAVSPFYYYELASPKLRLILKSYDTFGGHHINGTLLSSKRFLDENPKATDAVFAAQQEANEIMSKHPDQAAAIYLEMAKDTRSTVPEMAPMISDPDNDWTTVPAGVEKMADFMSKAGRLRRVPKSWKDVYMPQVQDAPGS